MNSKGNRKYPHTHDKKVSETQAKKNKFARGFGHKEKKCPPSGLKKKGSRWCNILYELVRK